MRVLSLLGLILVFSVHAADQSWVKDNCPRCYQTADKNYLFKVDKRIIKFAPSLKADNSSESISIDLIGLSNTKGETIEDKLSFTSDGDRERFLKKFKRVCGLFKGFAPKDAKAAYYEGNLNLSCSKPLLAEKKPEVKESMNDLVNFLSGSEKKEKNLAIYDEDRGEEARNPRGPERLPASAAGASEQ